MEETSNGYVGRKLFQDIFCMIMHSNETIAFVSVSTYAAEIYYTLHTRLSNGLYINMGNVVYPRQYILHSIIGVSEVATRRHHTIHGICACKSNGLSFCTTKIDRLQKDKVTVSTNLVTQSKFLFPGHILRQSQ